MKITRYHLIGIIAAVSVLLLITPFVLNVQKPPSRPSLPELINLPYCCPVGITRDGAGHIFVAHSADHAISVIDDSTFKIIGNVSLASDFGGYGGPMGLVFDSRNGYIYAANVPYRMITVIDSKTLEIVTSIDVKGYVPWLTLNTQRPELYAVLPDNDTITAINTNTLKITDVIRMNNTLLWSASYNPDDGNVYAAFLSGYITIINGTSHQTIGTITVYSGSVKFIAFDTYNHRLYGTGESGVVVADTKGSRHTVKEIHLPAELPYGYYLDEKGNSFVYGNYTDEMKSNSEKLGASPYGIVFDPDNRQMYVVLAGIGVLAVIDTETMNVTDYVPTRNSANVIVYDSDNKALYISNEPEMSISIIQIENNNAG